MNDHPLEIEAIPDVSELTEANAYADVFDDIRGLTKAFIGLARSVDPYSVLQVNGVPFNSLYWIVGHVIWSQHFLIVKAIGNDSMEIPWLERFERGSELMMDPRNDDSLPSMDILLSTMDLVHDRSISIIRSLNTEQLGVSNHLGLSFAAGDAKRVIIRHALRHEPMHVGQITWLTKAAGGKTV